MSEEVYSNPVAPPGAYIGGDNYQDDDHKPLRNEDFRKMLLETPRIPTKDLLAHAQKSSKLSENKIDGITGSVRRKTTDTEASARRIKKKSYYAKLKKEEEVRAKELADKYRDRARERRDGVPGVDIPADDTGNSTTANYRAVAPDAKSMTDVAERRRQIIQESKFLGGDMEHTHLVKGLDYALLEKVRSEIIYKEGEDEELESVVSKEKQEEEREKIECKTQLGRNIVTHLLEEVVPIRNELFLPGRMAYRIDMDDEYADTDIPSTVIRSKADVPITENQATLSTNDIVINKLTQILAYLRQGVRKKSKKKEKGKIKEEMKRAMDENIFEDVGEYVPSIVRREEKKQKGRGRERGHQQQREMERGGGGRGGSYFERPADGERVEETDKERKEAVRQFVRNVNERYHVNEKEETKDESAKKKEEKLKRLIQPTGYEECYPGAMAAEDAVIDSDDEADYSKMDMGKKKGPLGRWDFDTQEEYSSYMSNKEAMPRAAFQYGVKMSDGRKTRKNKEQHKDEKAQLDRQWEKIQKIISKRQDDGPAHKKAKH